LTTTIQQTDIDLNSITTSIDNNSVIVDERKTRKQQFLQQNEWISSSKTCQKDNPEKETYDNVYYNV